MRGPYRQDLAHDLVLPTLLFAVLGAMTWAVRGCAGAGGMNAHVAPGLTWGAAWWFLARDRGYDQSRRYASGWILLALAAGFAIAGERGWMQWPNFFSGQLATNYARGEYVPIARTYGFIWFFIAGTAWAGLPACVLAWCGSGRSLRAWEWSLRLACGFGAACLAWRVFTAYPRVFLPLYDSIQAKYLDFHANPNLAKLYRDNGASMRHIGFYLGFLLFEAVRRDWKNVKLIASVGLLTGLGWAGCQNWRWAPSVWPGAAFNFGRCWEVSGGICIGIGLGVAYYLANRRMSAQEAAVEEARLARSGRVSEWLTASGLLLLVGAAMFWPAARDLRQPASLPGDGPDYLWGCVFLAAGFAAGAIGVAQYLLGRRSAEGERLRPRTARIDLEWWGELGLVLVFGWFIKTQMMSTYGDGVADGAMAGWFGPGSLYFVIGFLYCVACAMRRLAARRIPSGAGSEEGVKPAWWLGAESRFAGNLSGPDRDPGLVSRRRTGELVARFDVLWNRRRGVRDRLLLSDQPRGKTRGFDSAGDGTSGWGPQSGAVGRFSGFGLWFGPDAPQGPERRNEHLLRQRGLLGRRLLGLGFLCDAALPGGWNSGAPVAANPKEFPKGCISRSL